MVPDPARTVVLSQHHRIEIGTSSWDPSATSIRNRYDDPGTRRFSPHGSSELPLGDLEPIMAAASRHDLLNPATCARLIQVLAASIERQVIAGAVQGGGASPAQSAAIP